jgi:hypothetical protein
VADAEEAARFYADPVGSRAAAQNRIDRQAGGRAEAVKA